MKRPPLTPKKRAFVEHYALDHNGAAAAVRAGYAPGSARVTASRLLTNAAIQAAVAEREVEAAIALNVTREGVLAALQKAYEDARLLGDPAVMVSAARAVAQICGFYASERHHVAVTSTPAAAAMMAKMEAMSDAELLARIAEPDVTD